MKKKLLTALLVSSACVAGVFGIAACSDAPAEHTHKWSGWSVTDADKPTQESSGKATRTCTGSGDCDATAEDNEFVIPALTSTDYSKSADSATCSDTGKITYTYNKDGKNVSFDIDTPVNANAHSYGDYVKTDPDGHYKVCANNADHKTAAEEHDTQGEDGACSVCGYKPVHNHAWNPWTVTDENKPTYTVTGKATRTCRADGCDATAEDKECVLPVLTSADYSKTPDNATCTEKGTVTYTYNKGGVNVSFGVTTPVNPNNHVYGPDGYCTECYTATADPTRTKIKFVTGAGITFKATVFTAAEATYTFTYEGEQPVTVKYGNNSMAEANYSEVTLQKSGTTSFDLGIATMGMGYIIITSDSAEQIEGVLNKRGVLGENSDGYPVYPSAEGEAYDFIGGTEGKFQYVLTADNVNAKIYVDGESGKEEITLPYKFRVGLDERKTFYMSYSGGTEVASYNVAIEREWDEGSVMNPTEVAIGAETIATVAAGNEHYYSFVPDENGWYKISSDTENAVLIAGLSTSTSANRRYGTLGKGFDYRFYVEDCTIYNADTGGYFFRIVSDCTFKVEKTEAPAQLSVTNASQGYDFYTFTSAAKGPGYKITVSELPPCGYWTVEYVKDGNKTVLDLTAVEATVVPDPSTAFTLIYNNTAGNVTLTEVDSTFQLSIGTSASESANTVRYFVVPADGNYTFTTSADLTSGSYFWKVNGEICQQNSVTLEDLKVKDVITVMFANVMSKTRVTILPEGAVALSEESGTEVTVGGGKELVYLTGIATLEYKLDITGSGVTFEDGTQTAVITADANGNVLAYVVCAGESASATVTVTLLSKYINGCSATNARSGSDANAELKAGDNILRSTSSSSYFAWFKVGEGAGGQYTFTVTTENLPLFIVSLRSNGTDTVFVTKGATKITTGDVYVSHTTKSISGQTQVASITLNLAAGDIVAIGCSSTAGAIARVNISQGAAAETPAE